MGTTTLSEQDKKALRVTALEHASRNQPTSFNSFNGLDQRDQKSVTKLLSDATEIYKWLTDKEV